jgi:hypothetical protein
MQFSPRSVFLPFRSKYLPQHSLLKNALCSSPKVRDQVSHPYSTTGKIIVLYILIFRFFIWYGKRKDFGLNNRKHSLNLMYSWFHHECHSDLLASSPRYLDFANTGIVPLNSATPPYFQILVWSLFMFITPYWTLYEVVSKSFRTGRLERQLQMVQLSATMCSCIAILWVSLMSFAAITLCVAFQRLFIAVYFVIDSGRKFLETPSCVVSIWIRWSALFEGSRYLFSFLRKSPLFLATFVF